MEFNFWDECIEIISEQIDISINKDPQILNQIGSKPTTLSFNSVDKILYVLSKSGKSTLDVSGSKLHLYFVLALF